MQKITPFLWFDGRAGEAANSYAFIFKDSKGGRVTRYGDEAAKASGRAKGTVMTVPFRIEGQEFVALNGGPHFTFSPAISLVVNCKTQQEVDDLWEKLSEGGEQQQCGWLKDKYGVSWQIVPTVLPELLSGPDPEKSRRVMTAILQMNKLDIEILRRVHGQR